MVTIDNKQNQINILYEKISTCTRCSLHKTRIHTVPGDGTVETKIMFIGEAPGRNEDMQGKPFVGRAGGIFDRLLESIGIMREDIYLCNILKCRPPKNRNPLPSEIKACVGSLDLQIKIVNPSVIGTLGTFATAYIFDKFCIPSARISEVAGKVFDVETPFGSRKVVPVFHPAVATYNPSKIDLLKEHFKVFEQFKTIKELRMSFQIPDTPEELFKQGKESFSNFNKFIPLGVVILVLLVIAMTSFYTVAPNEEGVICRFGKYVRTTSPGLHWKLPLNIEKLDKVKVRFPYKEEFGFRTLSAGINTRYSSQRFDDESIMLTGDLNVLDVTWTVEFKIKDPVKLLFNVRNPRKTVRDIAESVVRQVIGDSSVGDALTTRRDQISQEAQETLQEILDGYDLGIQIETLKLQDVSPPDQVRKSFNEVNEAKQEKEQTINQAWEAYNKVIPKARGQASKTISEAEGYASAKVSQAQGDAKRFVETWKSYRSAKDVTKKRIYLETLEEVLPKVGQIYVFEPQANSVLPLLNLTEGNKNE